MLRWIDNKFHLNQNQKYLELQLEWLRWQGRRLRTEGPGFNPIRSKKNIFSCFQFVALEPMRSTSKCVHVIINNHKWRRRHAFSVRWVQVPVTIQETGDWGTYMLQLLPLQTSMVHISTRENQNMKIYFKVRLYLCLNVLYCVLE